YRFSVLLKYPGSAQSDYIYCGKVDKNHLCSKRFTMKSRVAIDVPKTTDRKTFAGSKIPEDSKWASDTAS
ncbi:hypothetical protein C5S36_15370, partial [Candidatus Methanophagaceae archaeon]